MATKFGISLMPVRRKLFKLVMAYVGVRFCAALLKNEAARTHAELCGCCSVLGSSGIGHMTELCQALWVKDVSKCPFTIGRSRHMHGNRLWW